MTINTIEALVMTYAPLLVTIISIIISFVKVVSSIKEIKNSKEEELNELKNLYKESLKENEALKKNLNLIVEKVDKIKGSCNNDEKI